MLPIIAWIVVGGLFLAARNSVKRYDLTNAAYSAFTMAVFLMTGILRLPDDIIIPYYHYFIMAQIFCFFVGIYAWKFMLRDVEQKDTLGRSAEFYNQIIGQIVITGKEGINSVGGGEVIVDGESFKAKISPESEETIIDGGAKVIVREVKNGMLLVIPKN